MALLSSESKRMLLADTLAMISPQRKTSKFPLLSWNIPLHFWQICLISCLHAILSSWRSSQDIDEPSTMNLLAFPDISLLNSTYDHSRFHRVLKRNGVCPLKVVFWVMIVSRLWNSYCLIVKLSFIVIN